MDLRAQSLKLGRQSTLLQIAASTHCMPCDSLQYPRAVTRYFSVKLRGLWLSVAPTLATVNPFGQCLRITLSQGGAIVSLKVLPGSLQLAR